jgi:alkylation response protein AidB-like acyl-CoA dehydrogenase
VGRVIHGGPAAWTVYFEPGGGNGATPPPAPSAGRVARVPPLPTQEQLEGRLEPHPGHHHTVGVTGVGPARIEAVARAAGRLGASRVDAFALSCRAEDRGDHFALHGRKLWITNGDEAGLFLVFANANPDAGYRGITCFVVERGMAGFSIPRKEDKLGIRASSTCELVFEGVEVPRANVLGDVGKGYKVAIETLNEGRIGIGAQMTGLARGALEGALGYVQEREQFGQKIAEFQAVRHRLARCATELEAARLLVYNAARLHDAGQPFLREAAMAKWFASEVAERLASECLELWGGVGFTKECPAEKLLRDAKIGKIYEGTSFIQLDTIAKSLLGEGL